MIVNPILYQQGTKLPELTNPGSAADLLAGKQLVDQYGNPLTGTMPEVELAVPGISIDANGLITASAVQEAGHVAAGTRSATKQLTKRDASSLSASGAAVTVPAGYYPSQVSKSVATAAHPKPTISRSGGTITAQHVQSAGYTSGGTTTETLSITTQSGKTVTPGTSRQTAVASGRLTTGAVYVAGDANLVAANIKSGVSIFGVAGTLESGPESCNLLLDNRSNWTVMGLGTSPDADTFFSAPMYQSVTVVLRQKSIVVIDARTSATVTPQLNIESSRTPATFYPGDGSSWNRYIFTITGDATIKIT